MEITEVRAKLVSNKDDRLKAFCSITMDREFVVRDIKIIEGLFSFYPASVRTMFDKKIFVEIDKALFQERKSTDKRWEEEPDWYADHMT